ncbi:MAG TPA: Maf family protein [Terriglobales bacterium]|nr:Maf family protein [Terriglobales bacterium]
MTRSPDRPILVLASASPRRQELLRNAGFEFVVRPAHIPENRLAGEHPEAYVKRLAREKARTVWEKEFNAKDAKERKAVMVLGADTTVVVDEHVLEKPRDARDAARMLRLLSGRTHQVMTGVCLVAEGVEKMGCEITQVTFSRLSESDIAGYIATGEPMDKAGAYAIQGIASRWIPRIEGDYGNVVGLPVAMVCGMLRDAERKFAER